MNPILSAMLKFAILGTAGEIAAKLIAKKKLIPLKVAYSVIVWAILGAIIKFAFVGFNGFVDELIKHGYLPSQRILKAFFTSVFINAFFGPWLIIIHRFLEVIAEGSVKIPTQGLKGAMLTLLWFWVPAHTVTFSLPRNWQITLAAIWSFVLGLILGIFMVRKERKDLKEI